jgi:hypothetical protein
MSDDNYVPQILAERDQAEAERDTLAARLAEVERERDEARAWREANNEQAQRLVEHRNELMARADTAEARLAAVRRLHHPMRWQGREVCDECVRRTSPMPEPVTWPCPTIAALDAEVTDR